MIFPRDFLQARSFADLTLVGSECEETAFVGGFFGESIQWRLPSKLFGKLFLHVWPRGLDKD